MDRNQVQNQHSRICELVLIEFNEGFIWTGNSLVQMSVFMLTDCSKGSIWT